MPSYDLHFIDVFTEGRDSDAPFLTLWDDESIRFFFDLLVSSQVYQKYFQSGKIALVSFVDGQDLQTGTGFYSIIDGKVRIEAETGMLVGLLARVGFVDVL